MEFEAINKDRENWKIIKIIDGNNMWRHWVGPNYVYYVELNCNYCGQKCLQKEERYKKVKGFCNCQCARKGQEKRTRKSLLKAGDSIKRFWKEHPDKLAKRINNFKIWWKNNKGTEKELEMRRKRNVRMEETRKKMSKALKGHVCSEETKRKISKAQKGRKSNIIWTEKMRKNKAAISRKVWQNPEYREKILKSLNDPVAKEKISIKRKALWKNPEYVAKQMKARNVYPNKSEVLLDDILNKSFPNEYKYVGDGNFILAGKCPDFVNVNGQKKIVELYGEPFHTKEEANDRIELFKQFGYSTLIIWSRELRNKTKLKQKLVSFNVSEEGMIK